jgi:hypothetical protein
MPTTLARCCRDSFNDLVRLDQQGLWDGQPERPGRFQINHQLELRRLLYGKVSRLGASPLGRAARRWRDRHLRELARTLNYEQVKALHDNPMKSMLVPFIHAATPSLCKLDVAIFETDDELGFITSDHPCVWFDAEAYKRPPMWRTPALMYESIEISLPMSPRHCVVLNRRGVNGYIKATPLIVDHMNKRTRFQADKHFVARLNQTKSIWFDPGEEPEDSWEKTQGKEKQAELE